MSDPYKILGVPMAATDDEIKSAYRELVRKYHPDNYANNPLSELANEKMQEINSAYDEIRTMRERNKGAGGQSYSSSYGANYNGNSSFADVRRLLQNSMITQAQEILDGVATGSRDAEWYYLKGIIFYNKGWVNDALTHFRRACDMAPGNSEYQATLNQLLTRMNYERQRSQTTVMPGCCAPCGICTSLICADCACSAFRCCF